MRYHTWLKIISSFSLRNGKKLQLSPPVRYCQKNVFIFQRPMDTSFGQNIRGLILHVDFVFLFQSESFVVLKKKDNFQKFWRNSLFLFSQPFIKLPSFQQPSMLPSLAKNLTSRCIFYQSKLRIFNQFCNRDSWNLATCSSVLLSSKLFAWTIEPLFGLSIQSSLKIDKVRISIRCLFGRKFQRKCGFQ